MGTRIRNIPCDNPQDYFPYSSVAVAELSPKFSDISFISSCYPEGYLAGSLESELDTVQRKIDAGVRVLVSQFSFSIHGSEAFFNKLDARGADPRGLVVPGLILPSARSISFAKNKCLIDVPREAMDASVDSDRAYQYLREQVKALVSYGFEVFQLYTLNSPARYFDLTQDTDLLRGSG